jgi:DNA-binding LacI/PurR family transcriptional regulator
MFALATAGPGNVPQCPPSSGEQSGAQVGDTVDGDSYTAVFSGNDQMALGFMSAVRRRGKTAPEDFSIVGVDDMPDARYFAPALTSIYMDFVTLGRVGIEMLIERITTADRVERRVIRPELIVRESTAPVEATAEARTPGAGRPTRRHP